MHQHGGNIYNQKIKLDFSSNINLLGTPESVLSAAYEGITLSSSYPDTQCTTLRKALSTVSQIPMEQIICGNGAADLIFSLVLGGRPRKALIPIPSFYEYEQALGIVDCEIIYHEMKEKDMFSLREDFLQSITKDLDMIFLCNPNNPTGNLLDIELITKILHVCDAYDILLVVDECFMDFVDLNQRYSLIRQCENSKNLFILKAFTKLYAIPGLRLGYGFSSNLDLLRKMNEVTQPWNVSIPAQMAGIAALKEEDYVTRSYLLLQDQREYLFHELLKMNFTIYGSTANYIFFHGEQGLYEKCLKKGLLIRDCSNYKGLEEGYYRIAIKKQEENEALVKTFREVL